MLGSQSKSILLIYSWHIKGWGSYEMIPYSFMKTSPVITKSRWTVFFYNKIWLKIFLDLSTFDFVGFDDSFKLHGSVTQSLVDFLRRNVVSWQTNPLEDGARLGWFFPLAGGFLVFFWKKHHPVGSTKPWGRNTWGTCIRYVHMYISYIYTSYIRIYIYICFFRTTFLKNSTPKKGGFSSPFWKIPDHGIPSDS